MSPLARVCTMVLREESSSLRSIGALAVGNVWVSRSMGVLRMRAITTGFGTVQLGAIGSAKAACTYP
jgi:hypothetical protein